MEFGVTRCLKSIMPGSKLSTCIRHTLLMSSPVPQCMAGGSGLAWHQLALQARSSTAAGGGRWCGPAAHPAHLSWALHRPGRLRVPEPQQPQRPIHAEVCVGPGGSGVCGCHGGWGIPTQKSVLVAQAHVAPSQQWQLHTEVGVRCSCALVPTCLAPLVPQGSTLVAHVSYCSCNVPLAVQDSC